MGFDLYGMNPTINKKYPPKYNKILKKYGTDGMINWQKDIPEKVKDEYFELKDKYQEDNPGDYFRNNVWWWRPLWQFVCASCDDILTEKDMERGSYNEGHKISKTKATRIAKRLSKYLADGTVDKIDKKNALERAEAIAHNETVQEELDEIEKECKRKNGKDLVPANYPEPYKSKWTKIYKKKNWTSDYPFDKGNIEDFTKFCIQSGGFEIC